MIGDENVDFMIKIFGQWFKNLIPLIISILGLKPDEQIDGITSKFVNSII